MTRRAALTTWILLLLAVATTGPDGAGLPDWVIAAIGGDLQAHEPWVIAHFNLMGVWPLVLTTQAARRWFVRPLWLLPFLVASMAGGAFVLLPALAVVGDTVHPRGQVGRLVQRPVGQAVLALSAVALVGWGLVAGSPAAWWHAWQTDPFLHAMALDSVAVWIASMLLARSEDPEGWTVTLVPLLGTCWWTATRPAQIEATAPL